MNVRLARQAEKDLAGAAKYLDGETGSADAGDRLVDQLDHVLDLIGENPLMGRARPELRKGLRAFPHGNHTVFWRVEKDAVMIVRILHQKQDVQKAFGRGR